MAAKHILFVDDEARVRESLQRQLRPLADSWQLTFVASGQEALAALDRGGIDVLVTDLGMPGMTGPELLKIAMDRHPKVARLVLAPPSDQPYMMTCAAATHQFLNRPCDPELLRTAIQRACDVEASLRREQIGRLVARMDRLPSLPDLYVELVDKMADPECGIDDIAIIVARDISMTARILKLVNSAFFGLRQQVASPSEAVNYLGLDTIKALVLSINAFAQFEKVPLGAISLEALWNHSLMTAGCAKLVVEIEGGNARLLDEAFVSGMLHDTGKLALAANFPKEYTRVAADAAKAPGGLLAAEEAVFGATHAEVGGYMLGLWGLPGPIVDAVTWHHAPCACLEPHFGPLTCVHVGDVWAHDGSGEASAPIDKGYIDRIGMTNRMPEWHRACLETHISGVGA